MLAAQSNAKFSASPAFNPPPYTPVEPVVERLHGVEVVDPYRWLEDQNSTRTRQWLADQATYTRAYFDSAPGRDRIRKRVAELLDVETIIRPLRVGGRYFFLKRRKGQEQPAIMMREEKADQDLLLIDPAEKGTAASSAVNIINVSTDGKLLAYGVRNTGEDSCAVEFFDVERRKTLCDRLPRGFLRGLVISNDRKGFFYSHEPVDTVDLARRAVLWHEFGATPASDFEVFCAGENPRLQLILAGSPSGRYLGYYCMRCEGTLAIDFFVHDLVAKRPPQLIVQGVAEGFSPAFVGDRLVACTQCRAPNGRIVEIPLDNPGYSNWRNIVPESHSRISQFTVVGDLILVAHVERGVTSVETFDLEGRSHGPVKCELGTGTIRLATPPPKSDAVFYQFESFTTPPQIVALYTPTLKQQLWAGSNIPIDPSSIRVEPAQCDSKHGLGIPLWLISKNQQPRPACMPTVLTAYGGFGHSVTPHFSTFATLIVERGCLFVVANVRGGAERGEGWHLGGACRNRQNSINDFIAVAEWLLVEHLTAPGKLAIAGGSNGGLLVAAALTQRPDLFRAAVSVGPLADMLRYHLFDSASTWVKEYGSAESGDDFDSLRAYSPYHQVRNGHSYPAVMLVSGDADTRCNPMHARKMTARLQAATTSSNPIILDYHPAWGHTPVQPLTRRIEALTDRLAFVCRELEVPV